ncbi:MAG: hypothetical protein JWO10_2015 [Microbacteriaceae bacterium]|nr:hypothetical protein [Microbacteriaceae bacterium]
MELHCGDVAEETGIKAAARVGLAEFERSRDVCSGHPDASEGRDEIASPVARPVDTSVGCLGDRERSPR